MSPILASVVLFKNPLSTATFNSQISNNYSFFYKEILFPKVVTGRTLSPSGTQAASGPYVVQVSGFTSPPKQDVLRIFIALNNPSPRLGLNPRTLGLMASTLTITPPRRLVMTVLSVPDAVPCK
jgi:hypothetical protein